jgi:lysozyme
MKNNPALIGWLKQHEGYRRFVYKDTVGVSTVAYGRNLQDNGISLDEAEYMLNNDIERCKKELSPYSWYYSQPEPIRDALVNMCFNLGITRLLGFKKMIAALGRKDYTTAAIEALDSRWADQVKQRAKDIAVMIREGGNAPWC